MAIRKITAPSRDMVMSMHTALREFLLVPMLARSTVTHLPMFCPMTIGAAMEKVMAPVADIACSTPTEAEELCSRMVTPIPAKTPRTGLVSTRKICMNSGELANG